MVLRWQQKTSRPAADLSHVMDTSSRFQGRISAVRDLLQFLAFASRTQDNIDQRNAVYHYVVYENSFLFRYPTSRRGQD